MYPRLQPNSLLAFIHEITVPVENEFDGSRKGNDLARRSGSLKRGVGLLRFIDIYKVG